jgi:GrpB-like predicted nucleotidyltransferase (UPF0157 family)/ADP-ribose pyrophosphatase YjhB (NUDIX family)
MAGKKGGSEVKLSEHQKTWEAKFKQERGKILKAAGDLIMAVEHVGSTSIAGIKAKPIVDILVGVENFEEWEKLVGPLVEIGYEYVEKPELTDRRFFGKGEWGAREVHLHVVEFGGKEWEEKTGFRNYLREHPKQARRYSELKERLAKKSKDKYEYNEAKTEFITAMVEMARRSETRRMMKVRVRLVIIKEGKILLTYTEDEKYHFYIGGKVEYGETILEACEREMREEGNGAKFTLKKILYIRDFIRTERGEHSVELFILGEIDKFKEIEGLRDDESPDQYQTWVELKKLPEINIKPKELTRRLLADYKRGFGGETGYLGEL